MVVFILERVPASIRGELSRWLIHPKTGVFVGHVSARVRDLLWARLQRSMKRGAALLIYTCDAEQGYAIRTFGNTKKMIQDYEGLTLPKTRLSE
jgi:CRISPR-associated protein Cas2